MASTAKLQLLNTAGSTATATGTSLSVQPKSKGFIAYQKLANLDAATTVVGKIQHSPDNATWFDLKSFTSYAGSSGPATSETQQITDAVYPYVRAVATITGVTKLADVLIELYFQPTV